MKEVFEREKRKLSAQKPDYGQKRRGFDKVQTAALSSAIAALAVLLPKKAKSGNFRFGCCFHGNSF